MTIGTVLLWLLIAVAFVASLPALWLLHRGLWPKQAARTRAAAAGGIVRCFFVGLIPTFVLVAGIIVMANALPKLNFLNVLLSGIALTWGFMGAGGIATVMGERLWPHLAESAPWKQTFRGGVVLICCALLPVVGWLVLLPMIAIVGWGVIVVSWFTRTEGAPAVLQQPAPSTPPPLQ